MKEIWKDISGYEGIYQISNLGRVKSLARIVRRRNGRDKPISGKIMSIKLDSNGYQSIGLRKSGTYKRFLIHRLVAMHFIVNFHDLKQVNHLDENKLNNRVDNLEWVTPKAKANYGSRTKRSLKKRTKKISQLDVDKQVIETFESIKKAFEKTGINQTNISLCAKGKRKTAGGYIWEHAD